LVPALVRVRETEGAIAAAGVRGRVLGTVSAALIAAAGIDRPVDAGCHTALAPGFADSRRCNWPWTMPA